MNNKYLKHGDIKVLARAIGQEPNRVYRRLALGWPLDRALGEARHYESKYTQTKIKD